MASVTSAASAAAARIGAALSDAQYFESSMVRVEDIRRHLDSRSVKEKLDAMKRVIALISLGKDASTFFPDVVKNVVAPSLDVKKLVYLYLVHYAEEKQDLALLAINSFQKDLSDHNQHIRALSLRVLSSIRVKVILQIVILAICKAAKDSSAYVRKAAAYAIGKVCSLDTSSKSTLMEPLEDLLSDRSTQVMGSAITTFEEVCPHSWSIVHPHYRRICTSLVDVEPWGQINILSMLLRYARAHFANPFPPSSKREVPENPDLVLLLDNVAPLFRSLNNAVVASAIAIYYHLASRAHFAQFATKPLMRLVAIRDDGGHAVALKMAAAVAARHPGLLIPYVSEFSVSAAHSAPVRTLRMQVLMQICAVAGEKGGIGSKPHARRALLTELKEYLHRRDNDLAASAARAIGCLATAHPASTPAIVKVLTSVVGTAANPAVVTESIGVLRALLQRHSTAQAKALPQLISMLLSDREQGKETICEPAARASIIWLIGEFYEKVQVVATEALRLLAKGFAEEAPDVKLQILNLAAKVVAWGEEGGSDFSSDLSVKEPQKARLQLMEYVVMCAQYDRDYDVRDKARILKYLFLSKGNAKLTKSACKAFLVRRPASALAEGKSMFGFVGESLDADVVIGSMPHVLRGRRMAGYRPLEPWANSDSDGALRKEVLGGGSGTAFNREYKGVSSLDYLHYNPTSELQNTAVSPSGISSHNLHENGGLPSMKKRESASGLLSIHHGVSSATPPIRTKHFDPERFYDDQESSEYDDDSYEDEEDYESDEGEGDLSLKQQQGKAATSSAGLSDLLTSYDALEKNNADSKEGKKVVVEQGGPSEYDLDALLGGLEVSPTVPTKAQTASSKGKPSSIAGQGKERSEWYRVVENWNAKGLEVDTAYVRKRLPSPGDVTPVVLKVTNCSNSVISNVSFVSECGLRFACDKVIDTISPKKSEEVEARVSFRGKTSGVRFRVEIGTEEVGKGEFKPSVGQIVVPDSGITPGGFVEAEKSLIGMFASDCKIELKPPKNQDWMGLSSLMREKLTDSCFVSHVKTSVGGQRISGTERFSSLFAGILPSVQENGGERRSVLIRVTVYSKKAKESDEEECYGELWIGCENVVFCANLMQLCKVVLLAIDTAS